MSNLREGLEDLDTRVAECGLTLSNVVIVETVRSASMRVKQLQSLLCWVSYALGVALGRWDVSSGKSVSMPGPLAALPLHAAVDTGGARESLSGGSDPEWVADDEGTPTDAVALAGNILSRLAPHISVPESELRETMRGALFSWHLTQSLEERSERIRCILAAGPHSFAQILGVDVLPSVQ